MVLGINSADIRTVLGFIFEPSIGDRDGNTYVTPAVTRDYPVHTRTYKIHGGINLTDPVSVLASKAPATIEDDDSVPHCPSLTALKLAMMAIIYEEASDRERGIAYWNDALAALTEKAIQIQGGATQMHKSRTKRGFNSKRPYNFP